MPNVKKTDTHRTCTTCNTEYPNTPEYFYYAKRAKETLRSKCKDCDNRWQLAHYHGTNGKLVKQYVERNHDYYLEQLREWRRKNPNYSRDYYQANKARMDAQNKLRAYERVLKRKGLA